MKLLKLYTDWGGYTHIVYRHNTYVYDGYLVEDIPF